MSTDSEPRILGEGKYVRLVSDAGWEYAERLGAQGVVAIIAVTPEGRLILVEQYRRAIGGRVIELPAGLVGDVAGQEDEAETEAARRELIEETGYDAGEMEFLTECPSSPGMLNERCRLYRAGALRRVGPGGGDETEEIQVHEVALDAAFGWLRRREAEGVRIDARTWAGLYLVSRSGSP